MLRLDLTAFYLNERQYEVRGRLTVGDLTLNEFGGYALGLNVDKYLTTLERTVYAILEGTTSTREGTWFLKCQRPALPAEYACSFEVNGLTAYPVILRRL